MGRSTSPSSGGFTLMSREDFININNVDTKLNILFGYIVELGNKMDSYHRELSNLHNAKGVCPGVEIQVGGVCEEINNVREEVKALEERVESVERKGWWYKTISAVSGFIGGFAAMVAKALSGF